MATSGRREAEPVRSLAPPGGVGRTVLTQAWSLLTYLHWPYDPEVVRPRLPAGLEPDVHDGAAWVGLVPFALSELGILGTPPLPRLGAFAETNVRTYTIGPDGRRGVWFHSLEAERLAAVLGARAAYRLPYAWARMRIETGPGAQVTYRSVRRWPGPVAAHASVSVAVGEPVQATALDDFLTARWGLHSRWWGGRLAWAPVEHERWPLRAATLLELDERLIEAAGYPAPSGAPRVLHSPGVRVRIGAPQPLRGAQDRL